MRRSRWLEDARKIRTAPPDPELPRCPLCGGAAALLFTGVRCLDGECPNWEPPPEEAEK